MKALVLTYDRYHLFAHHMIRSYSDLWPDHPFEFMVPYNEQPLGSLQHTENVTLKKTDSPIKASALQLLDRIPDDEWVYWCIDDKYPLHIVVSAFKKGLEFVQSCQDTSVSGLCLSRSRGLMREKLIDRNDTIQVTPRIKAIRRLRYNQIWYHQFLRAKVLKSMFESFPDEPFRAKQMDYYIKSLEMPADRKLYVTEWNYSTYGESTKAGSVTANCAKSLKEKGYTLPKGFDVLDEEIIMGQSPYLLKNRFRRAMAGTWASKYFGT